MNDISINADRCTKMMIPYTTSNQPMLDDDFVHVAYDAAASDLTRHEPWPVYLRGLWLDVMAELRAIAVVLQTCA